MKPTSAPHCRHCTLARDRGFSRCLYCGTAVQVGRQPSEREQHETSRAAVEERYEQIAEARRSKADYDRILIVALNTHIAHTAEFTHDFIARKSGLNRSACQFALRRLQRLGIVRVTGAVHVRSNRTIPRWQFLLPPDHFAQASAPAPQPSQPTLSLAAEHPRAVVQTGRHTRRRLAVG